MATGEHLGRHEGRGAHDLLLLQAIPLSQTRGDTPVEQPGLGLVPHHDVGRLHIEMHDAAVVGELQGSADLHDDVQVSIEPISAP